MFSTRTKILGTIFGCLATATLISKHNDDDRWKRALKAKNYIRYWEEKDPDFKKKCVRKMGEITDDDVAEATTEIEKINK